MTSVALMIPSGSECLQPYILSNLDFVTESLTLMAGKRSSLFSASLYSLATPVVVSSETPFKFFAKFLNLFGYFGIESLISLSNSISSSQSASSGFGSFPVFSYSSSYFVPQRSKIVASPPSSTRRSGPLPSGHVKA